MQVSELPENDICHDEAGDKKDIIIPRIHVHSIQSPDQRALSLWMQVDSAVWFPPCE
jgi:hypothetical protein